MILNLFYLRRHPELLQYAIGINHSQFVSLYSKFIPALRENELLWLKQPRLRSPGGGRKSHLKSDWEKLFFILFYYKTYPTFRLAQLLWGLDKRNVQLWVRRLERVLFESIGHELNLPVRQVRNLNHWIEICPQLKEFIVDCTERLVRRPKNKVNQQFYYSGKKKRHTVKNQILVNPESRRIISISPTVEGKRHDKKLFEDSYIYTRIPKRARALADLGYQGVDHPYLKLLIPQRKPSGKKLPEMAKHNNKAISAIRVRVEHPFSYLKHFNILSQVFRGQIKRADLPFKNMACLYNFTRSYH